MALGLLCPRSSMRKTRGKLGRSHVGAKGVLSVCASHFSGREASRPQPRIFPRDENTPRCPVVPGFRPHTLRRAPRDALRKGVRYGRRNRNQRPAENPKAALLPRISVRGNHFVDSSGATVLFRGLSIADPDNLVERGRWNRDLFVAVRDTGANLVRIPVHPAAWRSRTKEGYLRLLDQAVDWCTDLGMHVIIDWHSIGNLQTEMFQSDIYNTTKAETFDFWRTIAMRYHGNHTVAFYDLFNEPTHFNGMLGTKSWSQWRDLNEEMIGIIRYWDRETVPLVAGFDWAYDLTALHSGAHPLEGIGYVTHPYLYKRLPALGAQVGGGLRVRSRHSTR